MAIEIILYKITLLLFTDDWQELIDYCFSHIILNIRNRAAIALPSVCNEYYIVNGEINQEKRNCVIEKYTNQITVPEQTVRMGYSLALGKSCCM